MRYSEVGGEAEFMTEAIGVVAPATRRAAGAITLARFLWWMALLTIVVATGRVVATYDVLSITFDKPAHIAAGMQLLDEDQYAYEALHPPLARIAVALGPYLAGYARSTAATCGSRGDGFFMQNPAIPISSF